MCFLNDDFLGISAQVRGCLILGLAPLRGCLFICFRHAEAVVKSISTEHALQSPQLLALSCVYCLQTCEGGQSDWWYLISHCFD